MATVNADPGIGLKGETFLLADDPRTGESGATPVQGVEAEENLRPAAVRSGDDEEDMLGGIRGLLEEEEDGGRGGRWD